MNQWLSGQLAALLREMRKLWRRRVRKLYVTAYNKHRFYPRRTHMGVTTIPVAMNVGDSFSIELSELPANGVQDSIPTYSDVPSVPGVVSITPAADGLSALVKALAPGIDTIGASVVSLGTTVQGDASVVVTVAAPPPPPVAIQTLHVTVSAVTPGS